MYPPGRYLPGPNFNYILFPTTLQEITLRLSAATGSGDTLDIDVSVFYRLKPDEVIEVYQRDNQQYDARLSDLATGAIKGTTEDFVTAEDWYQNRTEIGDAMFNAVVANFDDKNVIVDRVGLRNVAFQPTFEDKILDKVVKIEETNQATIDGQIIAIEAQRDFDVNQIDLATQLLSSQASALASQTVAAAEAEATRIRIQAEADAYALLKSDLGLTDDEVLYYIWTRKIAEDSSATLITNLDDLPLQVKLDLD